MSDRSLVQSIDGGATSSPVESVRALVSRLAGSVAALSALGAVLGSRADGEPPESLAAPVRQRLDDVLAAMGVEAGVAALGSVERRALLGEIRVALGQASLRVSPGHHRPGWATTDGHLLQAAGDVSATFPTVLQRLLPRLEGVSERLGGAGARLLDVGVGVAALAIELARAWPVLSVVGIDVWGPSLELARRNVSGAGLTGRITLREQGVQDLPDVRAFDLAWVPSAFIPAAVLPAGLTCVRQALRPGGWVLFASADGGCDPLTAALTHLRTVEWGGAPFSAGEAEGLLRAAGFVEVQTLPASPGSVFALVAGRAL